MQWREIRVGRCLPTSVFKKKSRTELIWAYPNAKPWSPCNPSVYLSSLCVKRDRLNLSQECHEKFTRSQKKPTASIDHEAEFQLFVAFVMRQINARLIVGFHEIFHRALLLAYIASRHIFSVSLECTVGPVKREERLHCRLFYKSIIDGEDLIFFSLCVWIFIQHLC